MDYWIDHHYDPLEAEQHVLLGHSLGENVLRLRQKQDLTKIAFSRMSGICRPLLDKIENGTSDIRLSYVHKLADALCVDPLALLLAHPDEPSRSSGSGAHPPHSPHSPYPPARL